MDKTKKPRSNAWLFYSKVRGATRDKMNHAFNIMDWKVEAERIQCAFGIKEACEFLVVDDDGECLELIQPDSESIALPESQEVTLYCHYDNIQGRVFSVFHDVDIDSEISTHVVIKWDGSIFREFEDNTYSFTLAKGLFHLDLLTPEVEKTLQSSISGQQKVEWALEFTEKYK